MPWSCSVRIISRPVRSPTCASRGYLCPPKLRWRMRPSFVRSNSAPHASSSFTRAGASLACSSAICELFTYCPPRIVSAKCTFQLSRSSTLARAAAIPPSAITVCALPSSDLQTSPTRAPAAGADHEHIVFKRLVVSHSLNDPEVVPNSHRAEAQVKVSETDPEQTQPGPKHVTLI